MPHLLFVGSYTPNPGQPGIVVFQMDPAAGGLSPASKVDAGPNPTFLTIHPNRRFLYAVNETGEGAVSSFALDAEAGTLTFLNLESTLSEGPCYISIDPSGNFVLVANYSGGAVSVLPIREDGSLGPISSIVQHSGELGPNKDRQEKAHAHCILPDPTGKFILATDLGLDQVLVYRLENGKLKPNDPAAAQMNPGAGPRHLLFSGDGRFLYVANELDNTVTACHWNAETGKVTPFQTVPTLPRDWKGENTVADLHTALDGRILYVSNRGHDSLALFRVDTDTGLLTPAGHESTGGKVPRNFAVEPGGKFLIAANQDSDSLVVFNIDPQTGTLEQIGEPVDVVKPVVIQFLA